MKYLFLKILITMNQLLTTKLHWFLPMKNDRIMISNVLNKFKTKKFFSRVMIKCFNIIIGSWFQIQNRSEQMKNRTKCDIRLFGSVKRKIQKTKKTFNTETYSKYSNLCLEIYYNFFFLTDPYYYFKIKRYQLYRNLNIYLRNI